MDKLLQGLPPWILILASGSIVAYWQQVKGFFSSVIRLLLAEAKLDNTAMGVLFKHLEDNAWRLPVSTATYSSWFPFVRPKNRRQYVLMRWLGGSAVTYWYKWYVPVFLSLAKSGNKDPGAPEEPEAIVVRFIRGTFDVEKIVANGFDAMADEVQAQQKGQHQRFAVFHIFGHAMNFGKGDQASPAGISTEFDSNQQKQRDNISVQSRNDNLPIGWSLRTLDLIVSRPHWKAWLYLQELKVLFQKLIYGSIRKSGTVIVVFLGDEVTCYTVSRALGRRVQLEP